MAPRAHLASEGLYPQNKGPDRELIHLAMGILTQAIRDLTSPQKKLESDWEVWQIDSQEWFDSDDTHPGSFLWVCEVIGAPPRGLRTWIRQLKEKDEKQIRSTILSLIRLTYLRNSPRKEPESENA
jgi:hypothetical protein